MIRRLPFLFLLCTSVLWASGGGPWWEYLVQAEGGLRLRQGPGTGFPVVVLIPDGAYVRDVHGMEYDSLPAAQHWEANDGNWTIVHAGVNGKGFSGWVHNDYLRIPETEVPGIGCATLVKVATLRAMNPARLQNLIARPIVWEEHDIDVYLSDLAVQSLIKSLRYRKIDGWEPLEDGNCMLLSGEREIGILKKSDYEVLGQKRQLWTVSNTSY